MAFVTNDGTHLIEDGRFGGFRCWLAPGSPATVSRHDLGRSDDRQDSPGMPPFDGTKIVNYRVIGGRLRRQSTSGAVMRIVLVIAVLVLLVLLWRAFVFDRRRRGSLRNASDISGDAKRNRDRVNPGSDPSSGMGAGPL